MEFLTYLILWNVLTLISAINTKLYLNESNDSLTFSIITFSYSFMLKIILQFNEIKQQIFKDKPTFLKYVFLAIFNIGGQLFTNISIDQTSVSFIYMIKASEPLFVLVLSYIFLGQKYDWKVKLSMLQTCLGVTLTVYGNVHFSSYGLIAICLGNLSNALRR